MDWWVWVDLANGDGLTQGSTIQFIYLVRYLFRGSEMIH